MNRKSKYRYDTKQRKGIVLFEINFYGNWKSLYYSCSVNFFYVFQSTNDKKKMNTRILSSCYVLNSSLLYQSLIAFFGFFMPYFVLFYFIQIILVSRTFYSKAIMYFLIGNILFLLFFL